jgi:nitrite reductase/ring-hydroxylating ferredoxin subunit
MPSVFVDVSDLGPGEMRALEVDGRSLLVCNAEGGYHVLENRCPHGGVALHEGRLRGCVLECPFHGGRLDVRDGNPQSPPIRRPAARFPVRAVKRGIEILLG